MLASEWFARRCQSQTVLVPPILIPRADNHPIKSHPSLLLFVPIFHFSLCALFHLSLALFFLLASPVVLSTPSCHGLHQVATPPPLISHLSPSSLISRTLCHRPRATPTLWASGPHLPTSLHHPTRYPRYHPPTPSSFPSQSRLCSPTLILSPTRYRSSLPLTLLRHDKPADFVFTVARLLLI